MSNAADTPFAVCTGNVVAPRAVITAAHCLDNPITAFVDVITSSGVFRATSFHFHPGYNPFVAPLEDSDVGIVLLGVDLPTQVVNVHSVNDHVAGEPGIIGGYGLDEFGGSNVLRAAPVEIFSFTVPSVTILYDGLSELGNTCSGDSGGPLLIFRGGEWVLSAVTSNGIQADCMPDDVSNFANLTEPDNKSFFNSHVPGLFVE